MIALGHGLSKGWALPPGSSLPSPLWFQPSCCLSSRWVAAPPPDPFRELWVKPPQLDPPPAKSPMGARAISPDLAEPAFSCVLMAGPEGSGRDQTQRTDSKCHLLRHTAAVCCSPMYLQAAQSLFTNISPHPTQLGRSEPQAGGLRQHGLIPANPPIPRDGDWHWCARHITRNPWP